MTIYRWIFLLISIALISVCGSSSHHDVKKGISSICCTELKHKATITSFKDDLHFINKHTKPVILKDEPGSVYVIVAPEYQGRVLTSTAGGMNGMSFGWINRNVIASGHRQPHMNVFGGEDRFWLGPEGGQFSIFFRKGDPFDLDHWEVPAPIDWGKWEITSQENHQIEMEKDMNLINYSDTSFKLKVNRTVRLLKRLEITSQLKIEPDDNLQVVGYESINTITNTGDRTWSKTSGLLSIWILGMYKPSPKTTVIIPFIEGPKEQLGNIVNDEYFGKVPGDRLRVSKDVLFFKGDGKYRSKIGISKPRALSTIGSYDALNHVLTIVQYTLPSESLDYVNSMWEMQSDPYKGDVVNSYNDGPLQPGKPPLGPFYELETSSPAVQLAPGEQVNHVHRTIHLQGSEQLLESVAVATLGIHIQKNKNLFQ